MIKIHNSKTMLTSEVHGYCYLAALYKGLQVAKKLDPTANFDRGTNTIYIHA